MIFWQNPRDNVGKIVFQNFCQADFIIYLGGHGSRFWVSSANFFFEKSEVPAKKWL